MRLESGPAKADRNWQIGRAIVFLGFALYFVYDGAIGYPSANRRAAQERLKTPDLFDGEVTYDELGEAPTQDSFERLRESNPTTSAQVHEALGEPTVARADGATRSTEFFANRYGYGVVSYVDGRVDMGTMTWHTWSKTKEAIRGQFLWAIIPALPCLYFLRRFYKAVTLRVVVDDQGMTYDDRRIAFDDMVSLRDYSPKGWIDLYYKAGAGQRKLRLDNEKVALFDEIVEAICQTKGFTNEVKAHAERKAGQEAEQAAEQQAASDEDAAGQNDRGADSEGSDESRADR